MKPAEPKKQPTNNLARVRKSKGLSQTQLADLVGVHWITISRLERGIVRMTDEWLTKLAGALDVEESELLHLPRQVVTFDIVGEIFPGGRLSDYDDDKPHTLSVHPGAWQGINARWYYVNTDALEPFFADGDAVCFGVLDTPPSKLIGRIVYAQIEGEDDIRIGRLFRGRNRELFTLQVPPNAPLTDRKITFVAPVIAAIFNAE